MSITSYSQVRTGNLSTVTVVSDLGGTIYFHWYVDGQHVARTAAPVRSFYVEQDDQIRIEVLDTNDADFDPVANAPTGWPARRTIFWVRSVGADVDHYRVDQKIGAGEWASIGEVHPSAGDWSFKILTPRLADLTSHQWRVVPVDAAGNDGTAITLDAETVVRTPDAPDFAIAYDEGTDKVTFTAA